MTSLFVNWRGSLWVVSDYLRSCATLVMPFFLAPARRILFAVGARATALNLTMLEHRLTSSDSLTAEIRTLLPEILSRRGALSPPPPGTHNLHKRRALVLQPPDFELNAIKKGVLLITFTETFLFFHTCIDVERLLRYFRVVLEPSWSGYCLPEVLLWAQHKQPIIVEASEPRDRRFLQALGSSLIPIPIGASDWIDHRIFRPLSLPKDYDVIYVANLSPIKRVHVYFRALKALISKGRSVRAALVLSSWGGAKSTFEQLLDLYALRDRIDVFMNLKQPNLNELLNRSKVSVLLSKKEGSNRTLFESMFADVPVLLLRDNIGVNKDYINEHTGLLVSEEELPDAIERLGRMSQRLSPRSWAINNIAPEITTRVLQNLLDTRIPRDGATTSPLWIKVNSPEATYMDPTLSACVPNITQVLDCFARQESLNEPLAALDARICALFHPSSASELS